MENQQTETQVTTVSKPIPEKVIKSVKTITPPTGTTVHPQQEYKTKKAIFRTYQVVWYMLGLIEILLGFRIFLKMLGANPFSGFASLIYSLTNPLALPFYGVFGVTVSDQSVFEWSTIIAGIVYALLAYGIIQILQIMKPTDPVEVEQSVDSQ